MVGNRTRNALLGLLGSLLVSAVVYYVTGWLFVFLFVPFVPFFFRGGAAEAPEARECPTCGFRTRSEEYEYCPRDGTRLE